MRGLRRPHTFDISDEDGPRVDARAPLPRLSTDTVAEAQHEKAVSDPTSAADDGRSDPSKAAEVARRRARPVARFAVAAALLAAGAMWWAAGASLVAVMAVYNDWL